jgi:hypothetical protein
LCIPFLSINIFPPGALFGAGTLAAGKRARRPVAYFGSLNFVININV